jgi:hypothetical protein
MERKLGDNTDNKMRFLICFAQKEKAAPFWKIEAGNAGKIRARKSLDSRFPKPQS